MGGAPLSVDAGRWLREYVGRARRPCPKCGAAPFDQFLPRQVVRFSWFGLRRRIYAVICRACKDIVGYEA